jgi:hypothetical protein
MSTAVKLETEPNKEFLRFIGRYLTKNKSDIERDNGISQRSALLRIPYTFNSKLLNTKKDPQIRIVQKHGQELAVISKNIFLEFKMYLAELLRLKIIEDKNNSIVIESESDYHGEINWIEILLQKPISKNRYWILWKIIAPYLRHTKQLSKNDSKLVMRQWLYLCNDKSPVSDWEGKIERAIVDAEKWNPISLSKLEFLNIKNDFEYSEILYAVGDI